MKSEDEAHIFADRLTGARHLRNLTQAELAEKAGVSLRSVQIWEGGKTNTPRPALLRSLAAVLQVPVGYLLGGSANDIRDAEGPPSWAPSHPTPNWLTELGERLGDLPDGTRRRLVDAMHAILDAVEPMQTPRETLPAPPAPSPPAAAPAAPASPVRSEPPEYHREVRTKGDPGWRPPRERVELSEDTKKQMIEAAARAAGLAPAEAQPPAATFAWPGESGSPPGARAPRPTSRGTGPQSPAPAESGSGSAAPRPSQGSTSPNPAKSKG